MTETVPNSPGAAPRVGRPRRGTEADRADALLNAATQIFLAEGFERASIDKVASEARVSTRTIYQRYRNKADLLTAVIARLVERDLGALLGSSELGRLPPAEALRLFARTVARSLAEGNAAALFRIVASEARHFPEFGETLRGVTKVRMESALAGYLRQRTDSGELALDDPDRAAALFMQMIRGEIHERCLFGTDEVLAQLDVDGHADYVVEMFLSGALPRHPR